MVHSCSTPSGRAATTIALSDKQPARDSWQKDKLMDTSRDRTAGIEGGNASIRLRYSRQFQHSGHTHSIDAEATLPVGADQEARELVVRELEAGVDQLARQIVQRSVRASDESRTPPALRTETPGSTPSAHARRPAEPAAVTSPLTRTPVSESMPTAPTAVGERTVRLADFINVIKRYWDMSPQEAMRLLKVKSLDGLNYREAFNSLKVIVESEGRGARASGTQPPLSRPVVEAPRQNSQNRRITTAAPDSRPPTNQATSSPGLHTQGQTALKEDTLPTPAPPVEPASLHERRREPPPDVEATGSPKTPIPIQIGVVRDLSTRASYAFEEEDDPSSLDQESPAFSAEQSAASEQARTKFDELKKIRGSSAASAQRLNVLHNVVGDQISAAELLSLVQGIWGASTLKKLKNEQVESLISWAKGDYFAEEAQAVLILLTQPEEE
jgi:hypothetical protein